VTLSDNILRDLRDPALPSSPCTIGGLGGILISNAQPRTMERISVTDNVILDPVGHGIRITSGSSASVRDVHIVGNVISNPRTASGVSPAPPVSSGVSSITPSGTITDVLVSGNQIRDADGPGLNVSGPNNKRWDIRDNTVSNSGTASASQPGIRISGVSEFTVIGNRSHAGDGTTQSFGVHIDSADSSGEVLVTNNLLTGNASGAVDPPSGLPGNVHVFENTGATAQNPLI
jgi:hypothetical protein